MYVLNCFTEAFFMCRPLYGNDCPNLYGVRGLRLCPSQWRGGLVYKGMDKGSFDDVTSFILRRHQINLCLSLLVIHRLQEAPRDAVGQACDTVWVRPRDFVFMWTDAFYCTFWKCACARKCFPSGKPSRMEWLCVSQLQLVRWKINWFVVSRGCNWKNVFSLKGPVFKRSYVFRKTWSTCRQI